MPETSPESTSRPPREIIHEPRYRRDLEVLFQTVDRADEAIRALEWFIARHPEWGMSVRGLPSGEFASWVTHWRDVSLQVVYRHTDTVVYCLSARAVPSGPWT